MFNYPHLVGIFIILFVWVIFYLIRPKLRKQMLVMSIITTPLAPISQFLFFAKDYWNPDHILYFSLNGVAIGIEELLFSFAVGGTGTVIYEVFRKRKQILGKNSRPLISIIVLTVTVSTFLIFKYFALNTIWASSISLFIGSLLMITIDKDLKYDALLSALYFTFLVMVLYWALLLPYPDIFNNLWIETGLGGINFIKIPIEEIIWFASWGMFSGVAYEFWINVKSYKKSM
jgi:hypothetical protein